LFDETGASTIELDAGALVTRAGYNGEHGAKASSPSDANGDLAEAAVGWLLERDGELGRIRAAVASAGTGKGSVLALEGSPGIGKTRLLQAAIESAEASAVAVLSARGGQMETEFAFGVVRQLFEPRLAAADASERDALLDGAAAPAAWLVGDAGGPRMAGDVSFAVLHGLFRLTVNLAAERPLLVVIDDAHWADPPSLRFLVYLARRARTLPLILLAAVRPEDPGARGVLLAELVAGPDTDVLHPAPLTIEAVGVLIRHAFADRSADPEFIRGCWTTTGGNPFLVTQLLIAMRGLGGRLGATALKQLADLDVGTVSRWIQLRLAGLTPASEALAAAVAVLGDGAEVEQATRLVRLHPAGCDEAVDALVASGILRGSDGLSFVHPLVRSAIYTDLPPRRRARLHHAAALLLRETGAASERVASHLLAAPPEGDQKVVEILLDAARSATRDGAPDLAVRYVKRALAERPPDASRSELLRELGAAELSAGQFAEAAEDLRRALECTDDITAKIAIGFRLRYALVWSDRAREVWPALEGVIVDAAERDPEGSAIVEAAAAGALLLDLSTSSEQRSRARRLTQPALDGKPTPPHISGLAAMDALYANESVQTVLRVAEEAIRDWHLVPAFARAPMRAQMFRVLTDAEGFALGRRLLDEEVDEARRQGSTAQFLNATTFRAELHYRVGALTAAEADARAALEALHLSRGTQPAESGPRAPSLHATMALSTLLEVLVDRGELDEAEQRLSDTGLKRFESSSLLVAWLTCARARLAEARGRRREAVDELMALGALAAETMPCPAVLPWRSRAALALNADDPDQARRLAYEELELARAFGAPRALGVALRAAALTGPSDQRLERLREAVAVLESSHARLEHARALADLGAALRRAGQRSASREPLRAALATADQIGARVLANRARQELAASGLRPRRTAEGRGQLTPSERRVAQMAADGASNPAIAQALYLTVKTVEGHLSNTYRKLGITGRNQLPQALSSNTTYERELG
jgi:DNA-binding CsgD family transcriptional regulator